MILMRLHVTCGVRRLLCGYRRWRILLTRWLLNPAAIPSNPARDESIPLVIIKFFRLG